MIVKDLSCEWLGNWK